MERRQSGEYTTYETRGEANDKVDRKKRYRQILGILKGNEMTAKEVAVAMYKLKYTNNMDRNNASPRLTELMDKGIVEPIGKKVCEYTGKKVSVYAIREEE